MTNKKAITAAAAATIAAGAAVSGAIIGQTTDVEGSYGILNSSEYRSQITMKTPAEFTPDIVVLKLNGMEVGKALLPEGKIVTYPAVVSEKSRLSLDMYVRGDKAAEAEFGENGKLMIKAQRKYVREERENEE
ncbi:MAG: hypothetical protein PUF72_09945 [Clostridiales bacterium]|nr:hypothetical protein [Clostridiales bacterium]